MNLNTMSVLWFLLVLHGTNYVYNTCRNASDQVSLAICERAESIFLCFFIFFVVELQDGSE